MPSDKTIGGGDDAFNTFFSETGEWWQRSPQSQAVGSGRYVHLTRGFVSKLCNGFREARALFPLFRRKTLKLSCAFQIYVFRRTTAAPKCHLICVHHTRAWFKRIVEMKLLHLRRSYDCNRL